MPATLPPTERHQAAPGTAGPGAANGWGAAQQPRIAPVQRERKPALILAGLLLALACGAVTAALFLRVGGRVAVLAVARDVPVGQAVTAQDLTTVRISFDPALHALSPKIRDQVVGRIASVELKPGSLLTREQLTTQTVPATGQVVVGVSLKPGQAPAELRTGDPVAVLLTVGGTAVSNGSKTIPSNASVLVPVAQVFSVRENQTGGSAGDFIVSLVVPQQQAAHLAQANAAGQIALVLLPAGTTAASGGGQ
jgi:hypothetical protein